MRCWLRCWMALWQRCRAGLQQQLLLDALLIALLDGVVATVSRWSARAAVVLTSLPLAEGGSVCGFAEGEGPDGVLRHASTNKPAPSAPTLSLLK